MSKFFSEEYIEKFIPTNKAERTQMEVFFDFISNQIFKNDPFNIEDLAYLNNSDLLESLKYYIRYNKVTAKGTAKAYIGNLRKFFSNLENDYKIYNDVFVNGNFLPSFMNEAEIIISYLNDKEDSNTASDKECIEFEQIIKKSQKNYSYETAVLEIEQYIKNGFTGTIEQFGLILSICAAQFVIEYGFANRTIINIKNDDIDIEKGVVKRGIYELPIPNAIKSNLIEYLRIRTYLLDRIGINQDKLFIKYDGSAIDGSGATDKLFGGVICENESKASAPFAKRCIGRMIDAGLNYQLIHELTGYSKTIYDNACDFANKSNMINTQNKITEFILPKESESVRKIGYMDCPICGKKDIKAISDEFVLIKKSDNLLYIACKECGEKEKRKRSQ